MPYWLSETLSALPAFLWVYLGVGVPWALALLPRRDWRAWPLVLCIAFAAGPSLLTSWMFVLGTLGGAQEQLLLRFDLIFAGTAIIAALGAGIAWRKRTRLLASDKHVNAVPLRADEKLLIVLIAAALIVRWFATAFWPFTAYDALWVYGYEGRLYFVNGFIPNTIDYYPQFLPLQFTYAQLAVGAINDHAARAALPFLHLGSILAAYVLGSRLFTRRIGLITAAIWALHPHLGEWARFGDLEVPLTFLFTTTCAFFLMAWTANEPFYRRRYALIAGLAFGAAMWTKPTAGAFVWGVALLVIVEFFRVKCRWRAWYPRFDVALITGLACIPLGAVWYLRNLLLGHSMIDFPPSFWLTQAARSGVELGWLLLALFALLGWLYFGGQPARPNTRKVLIGLALLLAGIVPSILATYHPQLIAWLHLPSLSPPHRMGLIEWVLTGMGVVMLWRTLIPVLLSLSRSATMQGKDSDAPKLLTLQSTLLWSLLLAAPYFVTWFYSYSYHYRLSFAIVPLLILPSAVILAAWFTAERMRKWTPPRHALYLGVIVLLALPGVVLALYDKDAGWDWLWNGELADDHAKYSIGNKALMAVVDGLQVHLDNGDPRPLVVAAPNILRLPFFFPAYDIRTEPAPMTFDDVEDVVYFVYGTPEGTAAYEAIPLADKQLVAALGRAVYDHLGEDIIRKAWWFDDGGFNYVVYELDVAKRFTEPTLQPRPEGEVVFGGVVRLVAHATAGVEFWEGRRLINTWVWEVVGTPTADYSMYVHLLDAEGNLWAAWDGPLGEAQDLPGIYYTSLAWKTGEYIFERRWLALQNPDTPLGDDYRLVVGFYDVATQQRLPVTIDGVEAGDGYTFNVIPVRVIAPPE